MHTNDVFMCGSLYGRDALGLIDFDSSIDIASKKQRYYELCRELFSQDTPIGLIAYLESVESKDAFFLGSGQSHDLLIAAKYSRACAIIYCDEAALDTDATLSSLRHSESQFAHYIEQVRLVQYQMLTEIVMHIECDQKSTDFDSAFENAFSELVEMPLNRTATIQQELFLLGSVLHRLLTQYQGLHRVDLTDLDAIFAYGVSPLDALKTHHTYENIIRHTPNISAYDPVILSGLVVCNTQTSVTDFVDYTRQVQMTHFRLNMLNLDAQPTVKLH